MSHTMQILDHLTSPITAMDALNDYGCFRLAARINELRMSGHNIKTEIKTKMASGTRCITCSTQPREKQNENYNCY